MTRITRLSTVIILSLCAFYAIGCQSTYPKERVGECIVELCEKEYSADVEVKITGKTVGVYIPISNLVDASLAISAEGIRKIDDVIMSVSRVALSTDAEFAFFIAVAQDPVIPELELVIIRYVEDIKRFMVSDISRNEYFDRMITEFKFTPQIQKEKEMTERFKSLGYEAPERFLEKYFKSGDIEEISDIGYWNGNFFLKDIGKGEFLAKQIAERVKKDFARVDFLTSLKVNRVEVKYVDSDTNGVFDLNINIATTKDSSGDISSYRTRALTRIHGTLSRVLYGYKFDKYSHVNIVFNGEKVILTKPVLDSLKARKLKLEDII